MRVIRQMKFSPSHIKGYVQARCVEYPQIMGLGTTEKLARADVNKQIRSIKKRGLEKRYRA